MWSVMPVSSCSSVSRSASISVRATTERRWIRSQSLSGWRIRGRWLRDRSRPTRIPPELRGSYVAAGGEELVGQIVGEICRSAENQA